MVVLNTRIVLVPSKIAHRSFILEVPEAPILENWLGVIIHPDKEAIYIQTYTGEEDNFDKDVSFVAIKVLRGAFATISIVLVATSPLYDCAKYQSSVGAIHSSQIIYTGGHLSPIPRELVGGNYPSRQKSLPTTIESNYLKE